MAIKNLVLDKLDLNDGDLKRMADGLVAYVEANRAARKVRLETLSIDNELAKITINLDEIYMTETDDDFMYQDIIKSAIKDRIARYFKISALLDDLPYEDFLDTSIEIGSEAMFMNWFLPVTLNNRKYIMSNVFGQGESFIVIQEMAAYINETDKSSNHFKAVTKYYDLLDVLGLSQAVDK